MPPASPAGNPAFPSANGRSTSQFPDARLAIEIDGWAWHTDVDRFRTDRHEGNALVAAGWTVLRFTWHDLTNRPDYVLAQIKAALLTAAASA